MSPIVIYQQLYSTVCIVAHAQATQMVANHCICKKPKEAGMPLQLLPYYMYTLLLIYEPCSTLLNSSGSPVLSQYATLLGRVAFYPAGSVKRSLLLPCVHRQAT